ncbi:C_GCAxxG_C_C family probable redox protein [Dysgonomonas sp. PH5-45]|uniref:C-GCAxxG-C-C family protein n=1 Tax=unclassified Dysgonomonas TaxID=2630389 RepID=UPI002473422E|nr:MULTISPECIES: C-GCAxxG-C-C family protein [unclassified Dysgonomonas]MDH6354868.1 C_GCAxxG_C_C family probable redox protein [Dysgonomonas sp. PH5-45]MDH6387767.1 C_GCAxxG_C_C family probable redox protein [Dysgonomonas sp. PH5-37]
MKDKLVEDRVEKAVELHKSGYNCAQAVAMAYADLFGVDTETIAKLSCSFGGGLGGLREVCGAVSGMSMIAGLATGMANANRKEDKQRNYKTVQMLAQKFEEENGSILCKRLLGLEPGLAEGKKKKPCQEYVRYCARLIEENLLRGQ